jgi:hypothetical protein
MNHASTLGRCGRNIGRVVFRQQGQVSLANTIGSGADAGLFKVGAVDNYVAVDKDE